MVHEYLDVGEMPEGHEFQVRDDVYIKVNVGEGARSLNITQEEKFLKDARLLEEELVRNPTDSRSMYYLGQSYHDAGHTEKARETFIKRVALGGWEEETFWAQYQVGVTTEELEPENEERVLRDYLDAYEMRPSRIEPLYELSQYFRARKNYGKAFLFASVGATMPIPDDSLFVNYEAYRWLMLDELCTIAYYVDRNDEGSWACRSLISKAEEIGFSPRQLDRFQTNLAYYQD